jgi:hypothetical protein
MYRPILNHVNFNLCKVPFCKLDALEGGCIWPECVWLYDNLLVQLDGIYYV